MVYQTSGMKGGHSTWTMAESTTRALAKRLYQRDGTVNITNTNTNNRNNKTTTNSQKKTKRNNQNTATRKGSKCKSTCK